jgi:hypothetical protein
MLHPSIAGVGDWPPRGRESGVTSLARSIASPKNPGIPTKSKVSSSTTRDFPSRSCAVATVRIRISALFAEVMRHVTLDPEPLEGRDDDEGQCDGAGGHVERAVRTPLPHDPGR